MSLERKQARAVQAATGLGYQRCLMWVRANRDALRARTSQMHSEHGLTEAGKRAAVELAARAGIDGLSGKGER